MNRLQSIHTNIQMITRMKMIRASALVALAVTLIFQGHAFGEDAKKPNIVFIIVDDLGYRNHGFRAVYL